MICLGFQADAGKALVDGLGPKAHFNQREIADYEDLVSIHGGAVERGQVGCAACNADIANSGSIYI